MKARNEKGVIKVYSQAQFEKEFYYYNGTHNWHKNDVEVLENEGVFDVFVPALLSTEKLGAIYFDSEMNAFTYPIEEIVIIEPTAQELYDKLVIEGNVVFDEFRKMLSEAASPYTILGTVPDELKVLTQTMLDAKTRIADGLAYYLSIDDLDTLKAFSFQTEESEQLKQAIENFK